MSKATDTNIKVTVVQFTPEWNNKTANYNSLHSLLTNITGDIIVLPELCTTGYSFLTKTEALQQADDATTVFDFFAPFAKESGAVIIGGFAEKENEPVYNSAFIIMPDGKHKVYRKTHLFYKEKLAFDEGNTGFFTITHPYKDCRIGVMVCYDWRFPESARTLALQGADIICVPANLVTPVWQTGMAARALENNVFVAVANRAGNEERILDNGEIQRLTFTGKSALYNIDGSPLKQLKQEPLLAFTKTIDVMAARKKSFNEFNDIFNDRRPDMYQ